MTLKTHPKNILILRLSSFGDIVLTEPIARSLKLNFPNARLCFVTLKQFQELVSMFESIDNVVGIDKQTWAWDIKEILAADFDLAIDLHNTLRTHAILRRLKPARVIRYRRERLKRFLCVYMPILWRGNLTHTVDLYAEPLEKIGIHVEERIPRIRMPAEEEKSNQVLLDDTAIGICPGAGSPYKMWPAEKYAQLARRFLDIGHRVFLIGWKTDREQIEKCRGMIGSDVNPLIGENLKDVARGISRCKVVIGNDSGLMHFAAALGVKVAVIFGPSSPLLGFAPISPWSTAIFREIRCSPCSYHGNVPCKYGHYNCFELISPDDVAKQLVEMIREAQ